MGTVKNIYNYKISIHYVYVQHYFLVPDLAIPAALIGGIMGASIPILLVLSSVFLCLGVYFWKKRRENAVDDEVNKIVFDLQQSIIQKASPDYDKRYN